MIEWDDIDIPIVGRLGAVGGATTDLVFNGGEIIVGLSWGLLDNVDILVAIVSGVERLAERIEWIPVGAVDQAVTALTVSMLMIYTARLVSRLGDDVDDT